MTFRVEDLTVSLLPQQLEMEGADCTQCTKCTAQTGGPSDCSCPSDNEGDCNCPQCEQSSEEKTREQMGERHLEALHSQLDELLATVG